ncbi:MAG TPA: hypothetical protein VFS00_27805 [Polyangiaceae bacterium]|nr:hypothetical protein [Polyangiaceae bacterium]
MTRSNLEALLHKQPRRLAHQAARLPLPPPDPAAPAPREPIDGEADVG